MSKVEDFDSIKIRLASPEEILSWSQAERALGKGQGEVLKPETINYRTQRPEKDGLFCEKIFGPTRDYECYCGKYKHARYKGVICDKCKVEVTKSSVRRERMGYIKLAAPVVNIWFLRGIPSRIGLLLGQSMRKVESVVYFMAYIVTNVDEKAKKEIISNITAEKQAVLREEKILLKKEKEKLKKEKLEREILNRENEIKKLKWGWIEINMDSNKRKELLREIEGLEGGVIPKVKTGDIRAIVEKVFSQEEDLSRKIKLLKLIIERLKKEIELALEEIKSINKYEIFSETSFRKFSLLFGECFKGDTGAEAIKKLLEEIDLKELEKKLEREYKKSDKNQNILRRLELVRSCINSGIRPEWMCFTYLPVLPPDLRPMVQLDGGRYASSDLNDLYRRVINRNNRLKYLKEIGAPEVIIRNEKRMLQEAVDALIDNKARRTQGGGISLGGKKELKSLADMLRGKEGRFRQNLLGKRVDYSGRSVIVVGPELRLEEVGLPKKMALELFKPFIINKIIERGLAHNVRGAGLLISEGRKEVWEILEEIIQGKYILLNRAPTLHRLSIQAFKPVLIEGEAIQIHPLVCPAFNADFDGDQMAVYLPLSEEAQKEARDLMLSTKGILKPASGKPIAVPRQEMILGCFYLTDIKPKVKGEGKIFSSLEEAKIAYEFGKIDLQARIKIRVPKENPKFKNVRDRFIETSVGRVLFNEVLPKDFPFQNELQNSKKVQKLVSELIDRYGIEKVIPILDKIKDLSFEYATLSCNTWGMDDLVVPKEKEKLIRKAIKEEEQIRKQYLKGFLSESERKAKVIEVWQRVKDTISDLVPKTLPRFGSVFAIIESGSRGSWSQPSQMAGMKGLVANPAGEIIEMPIKSNYKEGLSTLEYFISTHGARKGTADTALRTSTAGYLTRRLVDVAHELIIKEKDCGDKEGIVIEIKEAEELGQDLSQKILGRVLLEDVKAGDKVILKKGELIDKKGVELIKKSKVQKIRVRSPLSCKSLDGICQACYGSDLTTHKLVKLGEAVGIVAAQSIGEPGTQLTMRTFHTGGVAGVGDITLGLPRVEELFELRDPKREAMVFEETGRVKDIVEREKGLSVIIETDKKKRREYKIPVKTGLLVKKGDTVFPGEPIFEGEIDVKKLFKIAGKRAVQKYLLKEIQRIYAGEGVAIHDKHIETIIHQMFSRVKITDPGDSNFSPGEVVSKLRFFEENKKLREKGKKEAKARVMLLGLTKVALTTDSFLSAASFQETSRVLIKAAIEGSEDKLRGLKENVIIGKLIPAGTGFRRE